MLDLLDEVLREPTFPEKDFDEIAPQRPATLEKEQTDPNALASNSSAARSIPIRSTDIRYRPTIKEAIERLDKVDARRRHQSSTRNRSAARSANWSSSATSTSDSTLQRLEAIFADWKTTVPFERITHMAQPKMAGAKEYIQTPDKEGALRGRPAFRARSDTAKDYPALAMGNYLLGGNSIPGSGCGCGKRGACVTAAAHAIRLIRKIHSASS